MTREEKGIFHVEQALKPEEVEELYRLRLKAWQDILALPAVKALPPSANIRAVPEAVKIWDQEDIDIENLPFVLGMKQELQREIDATPSDGRRSEVHFSTPSVPMLESLRMKYTNYDIKMSAIIALSKYEDSKAGEYAIMPAGMSDMSKILSFRTADICRR